MAIVNGAAREAVPFHPTPCPELVRERDERREVEGRIFGKIDDSETGLGALNRAVGNNVRQMDRIETTIRELRSDISAVNDRIDKLTLLLLSTLAMTIVTLVTTLMRIGKL